MHHFVVFVYLPMRRFKTTISMKKGLNYLMPVLKENTIDTTWVHNRDVKTNASSSCPVSEGARLLEAEIFGANMQL